MNVKSIANKAKKIKEVSDNITGKINTVTNVTTKTIDVAKHSSAVKGLKSLNQNVDGMFSGIQRSDNFTTTRKVTDNDLGVTNNDIKTVKRETSKVRTQVIQKIDKNDIKRFLLRFPRTAMTWFDTSKELMILAVWIATVLNIKLPKVSSNKPSVINKVMGSFIMSNFSRLADRELVELSLTFGSWMLRKKYFESENNVFQDMDDEGYDELQTYPDVSNLGVDEELVRQQKEFYLNKGEQFKLQNGILLKTLNSTENLIDNTPISLKYHRNKTVDVIDFVLSVQDMLVKQGKYLTDFDESTLIEHYKNYA